jgi:hypothetical protein
LVENASQEMRSEIKERLVKAFGKKSVDVIPQRKIFPPTREYTVEDKTKAFESLGIDSALVVTIGESASTVMAVATQSRETGQMTAVAASWLAENLEFATPSISNAFTQLLHSLFSRQNFGPAYSWFPRCRTSRVWKNTGPQLAGARVTSQG